MLHQQLQEFLHVCAGLFGRDPVGALQRSGQFRGRFGLRQCLPQERSTGIQLYVSVEIGDVPPPTEISTSMSATLRWM